MIHEQGAVGRHDRGGMNNSGWMVMTKSDTGENCLLLAIEASANKKRRHRNRSCLARDDFGCAFNWQAAGPAR
jgi:hypothetical protein